jgi:hypothetical protein
MPTEEKHKNIFRKIQEWELAQGKNFYQPNDKLYKWFLMPQWIKGVRGGNQSGKTSGLTIDDIMQIEGWHPLQRANMERLIEESWDERVRIMLKKMWERKIFLKDPPIKARCVTVDFSNFVDKVIGLEYEKWSTHEWVKEFGYQNEKKRRITWEKDSPAKGSFVEFMTYEQPVLSHGGAARDLVHHDEEPSSALWAQSKMRISTTNGRLTLGMTAEQGVTWTEKEIWTPGLRKTNDVYAIEMSTYENPINTQEMIDRIKHTCRSDAEIDIRIYGKSTPRGGSVYDMAKDEYPWIIEPFKVPEDKGYLIRAIDPHGKLPHAVLWIWVDYEGFQHPLFKDKPYLYEVCELFEPCNIPTLADYIKEKETYEIGREADFTLCDPSAWNADQNNPKTVAEQMQEVDLMVTKASKDKTAGVIKVKEMLDLQFGRHLPEDEETSVVINRPHPQIITFNTLEVTREERRRWRYPKRRQRFTDDMPEVQKPIDKDDHMMENEYRIALFVVDGEFEIIETEPKNEYEVIINNHKMDVNFKEEQFEDAYL